MKNRRTQESEGEWCESVVGDWLKDTYSDIYRNRQQFPDFLVNGQRAIEVTGLHVLEADGVTSALSAKRAARDIIASELPNIPFNTTYGPHFVLVEYDMPHAPERRVLRRELREALAPYSRSGQHLPTEPSLELQSGVRLGFTARQKASPSSPALKIAVQMDREGCLPDQELLRAMERALQIKTPKAERWIKDHPECHCWLVFIDRIGTILFEDNRQAVITDWQSRLSVSSIWDRILLFVMGDTRRPAAQLIGRSGPYEDQIS